MENIKTVDNTIVCIFKVEENSEHLISELEVDILGQERVDAAYEKYAPNMIGKGNYVNYPIKIDELRKILTVIEKSGCNYVSIDYHCDHEEYEFYGADVHAATEEEIKEENDKERNKSLASAETYLKNLDKKREELIKEIELLKNKLL
jgi:hypothetical protein